MKDFAGWRYYKGIDGVTNIGIISPDGRESRLLVDKEVSAWIAAGGTFTAW